MSPQTQRQRWGNETALNQSFLAFADEDYQAPLAVRMWAAHVSGLMLFWQSVGFALMGKSL